MFKFFKKCKNNNVVTANCSFKEDDKISDYIPIISDDKITLSWYSKFESDIRKCDTIIFNISLNNSNEVIGEITFKYNQNEYILYCGNVTYYIDDQYRNNHYATRALKLLKKLLIGINNERNKDIYISTNPYDEYSQNVAKNNDAFLYYEGKVPEDIELCYLNGIKHVKIYCIKL